MKRARILSGLVCAASVLALYAAAAEKDHVRGSNHVFITGRSGCSLCDGVGDQHDVLLTTPGGIRFVLKGEGEQYEAIHKIRKQSKTITVRLVGKIVEKTGSDNRPYLECKVLDIGLAEPSS